MKKVLSLLLVLATLVTMVACKKDEPATSTPTSGDASEVQYKDTLTVATYGEQDTLDPHMNVTNDKVLRLLYDSLLTYDENSNVVGNLAETWEPSADWLTWTFQLKKGIKFASGKEMTSADVVASFERLLDKENALRYTDQFAYIKSVVADGDYTVVITLNEPNGAFEASLALQTTSILNADYIKKYGRDIGIDPETIDGTGPYVIKTWDVDEQMVFEANPYWHGGEPGCKNLIYKVILEASARAMAIETGEVDILDRPAVDDCERLDAIEGLNLISALGYGLQGFQFNCTDASVCKDTKVRQAISYALDREAIVNALYSVIGEVPTAGPVVPQNRGYYEFGAIKQDVAKAKQLLAEAGYPNGFDYSIMTYAGYNKGVELAEVIKAQLEEVGIMATIETVDGATFNSVLGGLTPDEFNEYGWDMFIMGFGGSGLDAHQSLYRVWHTSTDGTNVNNYGFYSNARVDELLEAAIVEMDQDKRYEMYKEIQQIIYIDDPVALFMNLRSSLYVVTDAVENFSLNTLQVVEYEKVKLRAN